MPAWFCTAIVCEAVSRILECSKTARVARPPFRTTRRACEATPGRGRPVSIRDRSYRSWHARSGSDSAPGDGHATVDGHLAPALGSVGFDEGIIMGEQGAGRARLHRAVRRCRRGGYVPRPTSHRNIPDRTNPNPWAPLVHRGGVLARITTSPLYPHGHPSPRGGRERSLTQIPVPPTHPQTPPSRCSTPATPRRPA